MGYYSLIQQAAGTVFLPMVLGLIVIKNLISVAVGGNILVGQLFMKTVWTMIPAITGWVMLYMDNFEIPLTSFTELVLIGLQTVFILISMILVVTSGIPTPTVAGTRIHRGRFLVPIFLVFLGSLFLSIRHVFLLPRENENLGSSYAPYDRYACEIDPDSPACVCRTHEKGENDNDTTQCVCAIHGEDSKECRKKREGFSSIEGFNSPESNNSSDHDNSELDNLELSTLERENLEILQNDPYAATDPRLNVQFMEPEYTPDSFYEDFFDSAVETNRQRKLVFGS